MNIKICLAFDQSRTNSESVLSLLYFQDDEIENQNEEFSFAERSESNKLDKNIIYRIRYFHITSEIEITIETEKYL